MCRQQIEDKKYKKLDLDANTYKKKSQYQSTYINKNSKKFIHNTEKEGNDRAPLPKTTEQDDTILAHPIVCVYVYKCIKKFLNM